MSNEPDHADPDKILYEKLQKDLDALQHEAQVPYDPKLRMEGLPTRPGTRRFETMDDEAAADDIERFG